MGIFGMEGIRAAQAAATEASCDDPGVCEAGETWYIFHGCTTR